MSDAGWNPAITTERLMLSPLTPADADELIHLLGDRRLYHFTGGAPRNSKSYEAASRGGPVEFLLMEGSDGSTG